MYFHFLEERTVCRRQLGPHTSQFIVFPRAIRLVLCVDIWTLRVTKTNQTTTIRCLSTAHTISASPVFQMFVGTRFCCEEFPVFLGPENFVWYQCQTSTVFGSNRLPSNVVQTCCYIMTCTRTRTCFHADLKLPPIDLQPLPGPIYPKISICAIWNFTSMTLTRILIYQHDTNTLNVLVRSDLPLGRYRLAK